MQTNLDVLLSRLFSSFFESALPSTGDGLNCIGLSSSKLLGAFHDYRWIEVPIIAQASNVLEAVLG